jgi:hypothetical protein
MSNAVAQHARASLDGRAIRSSDALPLDRNGARRRGVVAVVAVSVGMWTAIAATAWAALQTIL